MGFERLFEKRDLAMLYDWLQDSGELYMNLDRPHGGGVNSSDYFVSSLAQIRKIVAEEGWPEINISIFRYRQYPIRGLADEKMLSAALDFIPDGEWFSIISTGEGDMAPCSVVGFGDTHEELREGFLRLKNKSVRFGRNPFDLRDSFFDTPENVWVAKSSRHTQPKVSKNLSSYLPFDVEPDRYLPHIAFW